MLAGVRFITRSALVRASLTAVATVNFFNLMFNALYLLYAVRVLPCGAGLVGGDPRRHRRGRAGAVHGAPPVPAARPG